MKTVWKFSIDVNRTSVTTAPPRLLHVGVQQPNRVELWCEVDPNEPQTDWPTYKAFGTGFGVPDEAVHVGTTLDDPFVWHVYRLARP
jgi:hypothetical protein